MAYVPISAEDQTILAHDKLKHDTTQRDNYEKAIAAKFTELKAVKERLYQLRFDLSRPQSDVVRDVKNLSQEIQRIDEDITRLRKRELEDYERSLNLPQIGIELPYLAKKHVNFKSVGLEESKSNSSDVSEHETMDFAPETLKLMRTHSTQSMDDKSASERWKSLFKMFKEWKHQTSIAEAAQIAKKDNLTDVQDEIFKLRSAIYALKQRKVLSQTDRELLSEMSSKLQVLTRRSVELSKAV